MSSVLHTQGWKNPVFNFGKPSLTGDRQKFAKLSKEKIKDAKWRTVPEILKMKDNVSRARKSNASKKESMGE